MEKTPQDMTIDEARKHFALPAHWDDQEVAVWAMARSSWVPGQDVDFTASDLTIAG